MSGDIASGDEQRAEDSRRSRKRKRSEWMEGTGEESEPPSYGDPEEGRVPASSSTPNQAQPPPSRECNDNDDRTQTPDEQVAHILQDLRRSSSADEQGDIVDWSLESCSQCQEQNLANPEREASPSSTISRRSFSPSPSPESGQNSLQANICSGGGLDANSTSATASAQISPASPASVHGTGSNSYWGISPRPHPPSGAPATSAEKSILDRMHNEDLFTDFYVETLKQAQRNPQDLAFQHSLRCYGDWLLRWIRGEVDCVNMGKKEEEESAKKEREKAAKGKVEGGSAKKRSVIFVKKAGKGKKDGAKDPAGGKRNVGVKIVKKVVKKLTPKGNSDK